MTFRRDTDIGHPLQESTADLFGPLTTTPATGATTNIDLYGAYLKQLVEAIYRLTETAIADITDPVDMSSAIADNTIEANKLTDDGDTSEYDRRTDSQEAISNAVAAALAAEMVLHTVVVTRDEFALKNTNLDVFEIDAVAGTIRNLVFEVFLELDGAATYTPTISKTDELSEATFTDQLIPALATIATPAAAGRYRYEAGDLQENHRCKFNIAQDNAGDAAHDIVAVMTYEQ